MKRGALNAWKCPTCGRITVAVHIDEGTTPFMLACRAHGGEPDAAICPGMATSCGYPSIPPPRPILERCEWEWFKPGPHEALKLRADELDHVRRGGLLIRPITTDGRKALAERS